MNSMLVAAAAALAVIGLSSGPAEAAGCVKGAVVGGVAGHFVGHGLLGAGVGCAIGHHEAYRSDRERARSDLPTAPTAAAGTVTGDIPQAQGPASSGATATGGDEETTEHM